MSRQPWHIELWSLRLLLVGASASLACGTVAEPGGRSIAGSAGHSPLEENGGAPANGTGQPPVIGSATPTNPDAAAATPLPESSGTQCVNGVAVPRGSRIEAGGIAPDIPLAVTHATKPVPPLSGGTLLVLADGTTLAVSDPDRDQLYLVDSVEQVVRATVSFSAGDEPGRLIEDAAGRVHVVLRRGGALVTVDPRTGTESARRVICAAPRGLAYQADADLLHVVCAGGEVVSLPASGGAAARALTFERDLRDVVVGANGTLLVSTFRQAEVLVIGEDGGLVARLTPGSGPVASVDGSTRMRTPSVAWRMLALDAAANRVVLLHQTGVTDTVDTAPGGYSAVNGCAGVVGVGVSILSLGEASPPVATGFGDLPLALDLALSPDRAKVALAVPGNGRFQGPTLVERALADVTSSKASDCAPGADSGEPLPTSQVVAVSYSRSGVLFAQTREPATIWRSDTKTTIPLALNSREDTGHFLFHANSGGGIACASCHPEGGEDGRTWNFVCAGPRRTQSVRGGIGATVPFHWDGSELDFGRLVDDVFSGRMAGPVLSAEQKSAIESWGETIAPLPAMTGLDAAELARGKALFEDARIGCSSCHTGSLLTNNTTVDVGTGRAFQVPSLRGVAWRAPFMHDGCAATLAQRFGTAPCGGGDQHGVTSALGSEELDDLLAYLQAL
jgi:hypothetical protein